MDNLSFYLLDVFAEERYAGNQLAVFRDAGQLSSTEMQKIANEMHFSETTFILSELKRNGGYDVRIFTPKNELPFAGHPTLGTAYVIKHQICNETVQQVWLNLKVGRIPVTFEENKSGHEMLWMKQIPPVFGKKFDPASIASVIGIHADDIDRRYPVQEVSTGVPFIITPLKSLDAIQRARINKDKHAEFLKEAQAEILIFSPETYRKQNNLNVRVFVDLFGIPEDPATGSANGCLAGYLSNYRYFGDDSVNVRVEQGYEMGRPSLLYLKAQKKEAIEVHVGGEVQMIAHGKLV